MFSLPLEKHPIETKSVIYPLIVMLLILAQIALLNSKIKQIFPSKSPLCYVQIFTSSSCLTSNSQQK